MASIQHELWIDAPIERVMRLLNSGAGISQWWDKQAERETPEGRVLEHTPGSGSEHGAVRFLVLSNGPGEIRWRCISTHPSDSPASAWTGTEVSFVIGSRSSSKVATQRWALDAPVQTVLLFEHSKWEQGSHYLPFCSFAWANVLDNLKKKAEQADA